MSDTLNTDSCGASGDAEANDGVSDAEVTCAEVRADCDSCGGLKIEFVCDAKQLRLLEETAQRGLDAYNKQSGFKERIEHGRYGLSIKDPETGVIKACACYALWGDWIHIEYLWVEHGQRKHGWGRKLLERIELEARKKDCIGLHLTTISFQAPDFYHRCGFSLLAELKDFPKRGNSRPYMIKRFDE